MDMGLVTSFGSNMVNKKSEQDGRFGMMAFGFDIYCVSWAGARTCLDSKDRFSKPVTRLDSASTRAIWYDLAK